MTIKRRSLQIVPVSHSLSFRAAGDIKTIADDVIMAIQLWRGHVNSDI